MVMLATRKSIGRTNHASLTRVELESLEARQHLAVAGLDYGLAWPLPMSLTNSNAPLFSTATPTGGGSTQPISISNSAITASLIGLDTFRADQRFSSINGAGYSTVILDTGIDLNHPFFGADANSNGVADRIVYQYDFANNDANASDVNGHGSNVSSIVGSQDSTYKGVAPGTNIIHLKVFTDAGGGNFGYTEKALQWVVANKQTYNIVSVNMSLGDNGNYNSAQQRYGISDELATLAGQGVIVSVAAGNDFKKFNSAQGFAYPAADPNVLAVGAVYDRNFGGGISYASGAIANATGADLVTPFSQRSTSMWQIFAPGAPITGANQSGGLVTQHGTSQASPHIAGVVTLMQQLADTVLGRRLTIAEMRTLMASTADSIVDGDNENDNVTNTGATFKRIDVMALANAIYDMGGPVAKLKLGAAALKAGVSTVAFGTTAEGTPLTKTFTVENPGTEDLELSDLAVPSGFRVLSGFGSSTLAPGASTTFSVRVDAGIGGAYSGNITFGTNMESTPTFSIGVSVNVTPVIVTLDDGGTGVSQTTGWSVNTTSGYGKDYRWKAAGTGTRSTTWSFASLLPGQYRVSTTYVASSLNASDATYSISSGGQALGTATVDQKVAPNDRNASGVNWEDLGTFTVTAGTLSVRLTDQANGRVIADGMRIQRVGNLPETAEIQVTSSGNLTDNVGTITLPSVISGKVAKRVFTIRNLGEDDLELTDPITLPNGYTMLVPPEVTTIPGGSSTTFTAALSAGAPGNYNGQIVIASNDSDEATFRVNMKGTVTPNVRVLDAGQAGSSFTGSWTASTGGYLNTTRYRTAGMGLLSVNYSFTGLTPGKYRVLMTWNAPAVTPNINYSADTPVKVFNGATLLDTVSVNQQTRGSDLSASGVWWKAVGVFDVSATSMKVSIIDGATTGRVLADAVRIERVDNLS
jgi:subtilisin family serine protease